MLHPSSPEAFVSPQWYSATTEIEMGGQQLFITYEYLPFALSADESPYQAQEVHFTSVRMFIGVDATVKVSMDITDLLTEANGDAADFWERVQEKFDELNVEYLPVDGHECDTPESES